MADPVSAALTGLSVIQAGVSVTTAIWSFISEIKDAKDELRFSVVQVELAQDIAKELGNLILRHEKEPCFPSEGMYIRSKELLGECEKVFTEMGKILKQGPPGITDAFVGQTTITRQVSLSWYRQGAWPLLKRGLEGPATQLKTLMVSMDSVFNQFTALK
jgi:hypothetical protein